MSHQLTAAYPGWSWCGQKEKENLFVCKSIFNAIESISLDWLLIMWWQIYASVLFTFFMGFVLLMQ